MSTRRPNSSSVQQQQARRRVEARSQYSARMRSNNQVTSSRNNNRSRANRPPPPPPPAVTGLPVVNVVKDDHDHEDDDSLSLLSCDNGTVNTSNNQDNAKRFKKRQRKMQAKIIELQRQVESLTSDLKSKQYGSTAKVEKLAAQRDAALEMVSKKDEDLSRMMEVVKSMQSGVSQKEKEEMAVKKEQEEKYLMLKFECKSLKESLAKMEENKGADEERVRTLQDEVLQLKSNISVYSAQLSIEKELRAKAEQNECMERNERISISASMLAMAKEHAAKEAKFKGQYEEEIQSLQEELEKKEAEIESKNVQLSSKRDTITLLEEERNSMRSALSEKDKTEVNIIEENAQLRGEMAVLKDQLKGTQEKSEAYEAETEIHVKGLEEKLREGEALRRK